MSYLSVVNRNPYKVITLNGMSISCALTDKLGIVGEVGLIFAVISFAFSTILSGYYYGENNVKYLFGKLSKKTLLFLKLFVLAVLIYGAVMNPSDLWDIVDIGIGILSLINVYALFRLRKEMKEEMEWKWSVRFGLQHAHYLHAG